MIKSNRASDSYELRLQRCIGDNEKNIEINFLNFFCSHFTLYFNKMLKNKRVIAI